ncbi:unnamed protein product [Caenorhabditis nigoni]
MNVVKCPRRVGAKYVSISSSKYAKPQQSIPLIFRAYPSPMHGISVCVGPLYGPEKKWLEIAEFIEHYKLIGVRHFYFTIFNMNEYTRKIMDEYIRTGEVELTVIQSEYANVDWQFHLLQINECHQRAKYHSKWVINADIDERLVMLNGTLQDLIRRQDQSISEINFAVQRVMKTDLLPEVYENDEQILREMIFIKYNISADVVWKAAKCMYRPEKTASMYYHWSYIKYPGYNAAWIGRNQGYFLHYRTTSATGIGSGWLDHANYKNFQERPNPITFANELRENVLRKIKYVYDRRILYCEELPDAVYQEYIVYGHETFHCKFKSEVENEQQKKMSSFFTTPSPANNLDEKQIYLEEWMHSSRLLFYSVIFANFILLTTLFASVIAKNTDSVYDAIPGFLVCKLAAFLVNSSSSFIHWTWVAMFAERCFYIYSPLRYRVYSSFRTKSVITGIAIFSMCIQFWIPIFITEKRLIGEMDNIYCGEEPSHSRIPKSEG